MCLTIFTVSLKNAMLTNCSVQIPTQQHANLTSGWIIQQIIFTQAIVSLSSRKAERCLANIQSSTLIKHNKLYQ